MDYKKLHDLIICNALSRDVTSGYFERHHIVPKSMGGGDNPENIVRLTAREHYLVHWMLFKIYKNKQTLFAWYRMTHSRDGIERYTSRTFEYAKKYKAKQMSEMFTGIELTKEHTEKLSQAKKGKTYEEIGRDESPLKGRKLSDDHKKKVSDSSRGRRHSESTKKQLSGLRVGDKNPMYGRPVSDETRAKLSESMKAVRKTPMSEETRAKLSAAMKAARASKHWSSR